MRALKRLLTRIRNFTTGRRGDDRLLEEMDCHIAAQTEEFIRAGMTPGEAYRQAFLKLGAVNSIRESYHLEEGLPRFENLLRDFSYASRQLRKAPGFTATVVLTLALGLGASSAIFCLIDGLWLHPMHVPRPGEIVRIFGTTSQEQEGKFSYTEYQTIAARASAFQGKSAGVTAMGGRGSLMPNPDGTSTLLLNYVVSDNLFSVLGVHPLLGRIFTPADAAELRAHPGLVLGFRCWQRTFGGDPQIVGRPIRLRHGKDQIVQADILGVLPPDFRDVDANSDRDLWIPAESWAALTGEQDLTSQNNRWFRLLGRLAPGATVSQANEQVEAIASALAIADPAHEHGRSARAISDLSYRMSRAGTTGLVLFAIVGAVVLLCTVNVAQLLFARAIARGPEVALRVSLGASRWAVARQLLLGNLLLSALGWMSGLGLAAGIAAVLPRLLAREPAMLVQLGATPHFQLDWRVFAVAGALALVTALLLALVPLSQVAQLELLLALQASAVTRTEAKAPLLRRAAIWLQIGIAFALLVSTGVLVRSFLNTRTKPIGLTRNQVLVVFTQDPGEPLRGQLLSELLTIPGAQRAAYAIRAPLMPSEGGIRSKVLLHSHPEIRDPVEIKYNAVSPDFLSVVGTRIVRGRGFTVDDDGNGTPVVIVNQTMAEKYWPGRDPMGEIVRVVGLMNHSPIDLRIVGVAEDAPINEIGEIPEPYFYIPFHLINYGEVTYVVKTSQNAMSVAKDARNVLIHVNPLLDPMFITSLPECIRASAGDYQMTAELVSALGLIGLALTVVGLYGFLAFRVAQRQREIGIRMALGASREATAQLVLRDTVRMAAIGLAIGLVLALAAGRIEAAALFGVHSLDGLSLVEALVILLIAAAGAAWIPARRASAVDPIKALRME
jgi:predicted permease